VANDGSAGALKALDIAITLAKRYRAELHMITVEQLPRFAASMDEIDEEKDEANHRFAPVEAAEAGARHVVVRYDSAESRLPVVPDWAAVDKIAAAPRKSGFLFFEPEFANADADRALAGAAYGVEAVYLQPSRRHNAMEPSATLAVWEGDALTVYDATQHVYGVRSALAARLDVPIEKVRVIARHTGGGFGGKGWVWPHVVLTAAAARIAGRPVKLVLTRADLYSCLGYHRASRRGRSRCGRGGETDGGSPQCGQHHGGDRRLRGVFNRSLEVALCHAVDAPQATRGTRQRRDADADASPGAGQLGAGERDGRACAWPRHRPP
jgi:CO/xanthine dehydrogenase Mo-binding subunit